MCIDNENREGLMACKTEHAAPQPARPTRGRWERISKPSAVLIACSVDTPCDSGNQNIAKPASYQVKFSNRDRKRPMYDVTTATTGYYCFFLTFSFKKLIIY
jgi:hypothetical protein